MRDTAPAQTGRPHTGSIRIAYRKVKIARFEQPRKRSGNHSPKRLHAVIVVPVGGKIRHPVSEDTLEATGMQTRRMTDQEMFLEIKRALNPTTSDTRPYKHGITFESARAQIANVNIEDEQDDHLKVGGLLYAWVSLKELPDATFPGISRELVGQEFPLVISAEIAVPDQSKIMRSYKRRLLRMQAAQRDIHGAFRINIEAQIAQEQLIQTLQDVVSSSLKVCQLSVLVGLRTSGAIRNSKEREEAERVLADRRQRILHAITRMNGARGVPSRVRARSTHVASCENPASPVGSHVASRT
jgi:hypothetical protein